MICVKHRDASGSLASLWEYDPGRRCVVIVQAGEEQDIPVASYHSPRFGAYCLTRKSETTWQIAPAAFERQGLAWQTIAMPFPDGKLSEFVLLTHAPERVCHELERL